MIIEEKKAGAFDCPSSGIIHSHCQGSRCMAWRWHEITSQEVDRAGVYIKRELSTTHGYCGLAGRP